MSKNVVLTNSDNEQILPITTSENVFTSPTETLKETLERIAKSGSGGAYVLQPASATSLGGIKVGAGLEITEDGTLNCVVSGGVSYSGLKSNSNLVNYTQIEEG